MIDGFQVIEHIHAGYTTEQIKVQLVAQETADGYQIGAVNLNAEIIALQGLRGDRLPVICAMGARSRARAAF